MQGSPCGCCTSIDLWNAELQEPKYFIMDYKDICPFLEGNIFIMLDSEQICLVIQKETLSSKALHFLNILKNVLWAVSVLRDPWKTVSQQLNLEFKPDPWHPPAVWFLPLSVFSPTIENSTHPLLTAILQNQMKSHAWKRFVSNTALTMQM